MFAAAAEGPAARVSASELARKKRSTKRNGLKTLSKCFRIPQPSNRSFHQIPHSRTQKKHSRVDGVGADDRNARISVFCPVGRSPSSATFTKAKARAPGSILHTSVAQRRRQSYVYNFHAILSRFPPDIRFLLVSDWQRCPRRRSWHRRPRRRPMLGYYRTSARCKRSC